MMTRSGVVRSTSFADYPVVDDFLQIEAQVRQEFPSLAGSRVHTPLHARRPRVSAGGAGGRDQENVPLQVSDSEKLTMHPNRGESGQSLRRASPMLQRSVGGLAATLTAGKNRPLVASASFGLPWGAPLSPELFGRTPDASHLGTQTMSTNLLGLLSDSNHDSLTPPADSGRGAHVRLHNPTLSPDPAGEWGGKGEPFVEAGRVARGWGHTEVRHWAEGASPHGALQDGSKARKKFADGDMNAGGSGHGNTDEMYDAMLDPFGQNRSSSPFSEDMPAVSRGAGRATTSLDNPHALPPSEMVRAKFRGPSQDQAPPNKVVRSGRRAGQLAADVGARDSALLAPRDHNARAAAAGSLGGEAGGGMAVGAVPVNAFCEDAPAMSRAARGLRQRSVNELDAEIAAPSLLSECQVCSRRFNPDRLAKHVSICAKVKSKPPPPKHSPSPPRGNSSGTAGVKQPVMSSANHSTPPVAAVPAKGAHKKQRWREEHKRFQAMMAQNKRVSGGGGSLAEAASPSEEPSDYVRCPHCSRTFQPLTAERHMPHCKEAALKRKMREANSRGPHGTGANAPAARKFVVKLLNSKPNKITSRVTSAASPPPPLETAARGKRLSGGRGSPIIDSVQSGIQAEIRQLEQALDDSSMSPAQRYAAERAVKIERAKLIKAQRSSPFRREQTTKHV